MTSTDSYTAAGPEAGANLPATAALAPPEPAADTETLWRYLVFLSEERRWLLRLLPGARSVHDGRQMTYQPAISDIDHLVSDASPAGRAAAVLSAVGLSLTDPDGDPDTGGIVEPLSALYARWCVLDQATEHPDDMPLDDEATEAKWDARYDARNAIEQRIISTPAMTVPGMAIKLRLLLTYHERDCEATVEQLGASLLADLGGAL